MNKHRLMLFPDSVKQDPSVDKWLEQRDDQLGAIARRWFKTIRQLGDDVEETLHDGHPTACVGKAAFVYVNAFKAHVNVGFFHGAQLNDPSGLLEGTGKFMRHVKLRPEENVDETALREMIESAYVDIKVRIARSED